MEASVHRLTLQNDAWDNLCCLFPEDRSFPLLFCGSDTLVCVIVYRVPCPLLVYLLPQFMCHSFLATPERSAKAVTDAKFPLTLLDLQQPMFPLLVNVQSPHLQTQPANSLATAEKVGFPRKLLSQL